MADCKCWYCLENPDEKYPDTLIAPGSYCPYCLVASPYHPDHVEHRKGCRFAPTEDE